MLDCPARDRLPFAHANLCSANFEHQVNEHLHRHPQDSAAAMLFVKLHHGPNIEKRQIRERRPGIAVYAKPKIRSQFVRRKQESAVIYNTELKSLYKSNILMVPRFDNII